jgi:hypothetical protein
VRIIDLEPDAELLGKVREHFPHQGVRRYQADLANTVYEALAGGERNIVVEAPTGLGKGPDAVSPNPPRLPRAGPRGDKMELRRGLPREPGILSGHPRIRAPG